MTPDQLVLRLRADPAHADFLRDVYWDEDPLAAAERFAGSSEFAEVLRLVGSEAQSGVVLDVGAGTGIASYAFARAGARRVFALEPDSSPLVGRAVIERLRGQWPIEPLQGVAESVPLPDTSVDLVYARQTLHHVRDLQLALRECARVLKPGGVFLACREHVADTPRQLQAFLNRHPTHRFIGGEHAFPLAGYLAAIRDAGLSEVRMWGPWESLINAFPAVRTPAEFADLPRALLVKKAGTWGRRAAQVPGVRMLVRAALRLPRPGRLYTFLSRKPGQACLRPAQVRDCSQS